MVLLEELYLLYPLALPSASLTRRRRNMVKERLSKLQKTILTVLRFMDEEEYKIRKKSSLCQSPPPYWHRLRYTAEIAGRGLKFVVEKSLEEQYEVPQYNFSERDSNKIKERIQEREKHPKSKYFEKSDTGRTFCRCGEENIIRGPSGFDVSFSRSLRGLEKKGYVECRQTENHRTRGYGWRTIKHQIQGIRLTEKGYIECGLNVKI